MKSPWKYLVQLASRARTVEEPGSPREIETAKQDGSQGTLATDTLAPSIPASDIADSIKEASDEVASELDAAATDAAVVAVYGSQEVFVTVVDRSSADVLQPAPPPEPVPTKKVRRSRKTKVPNVAGTDPVEYDDGSSAVAQPPMTFMDEVAGLNGEILQMRRELAAKLLLQNTQLKKMLERYDR